MKTDFVDEDLIVAEEPELKDAAALPAAAHGESARLTMQRERLVDEVASAAREIERLRLRQEELKQEKARLAELNERQERYTTGKRTLIDDLNRALQMVKKDQIRAERMVELWTVMRARFQDMLDELHALDEDRWGEGEFDDRLTSALALVEKSRHDFGRAMAKIEAESPITSESKPARGNGSRPARSLAEMSVWFWFRIGLAFSLPLILALAILLAVYLYGLGGF